MFLQCLISHSRLTTTRKNSAWYLTACWPQLVRTVLGISQQADNPGNTHLYVYIYIYTYIYMEINMKTKQWNTQKHLRYQWMIASFNYNFTQLPVNARVTHLAWRELWYKDIIGTYISGTTRWSRGDKSTNFYSKKLLISLDTRRYRWNGSCRLRGWTIWKRTQRNVRSHCFIGLREKNALWVAEVAVNSWTFCLITFDQIVLYEHIKPFSTRNIYGLRDILIGWVHNLTNVVPHALLCHPSPGYIPCLAS